MKKNKALLILFTLMLLPSFVHATWYGENIKSGADIMMMDMRWPWWSESTYAANWNIGTVPPGVTAYGGFASLEATLEPDHRPNMDPEVQDAVRPGSVWSFWGSNAEGEPVRVIEASPYTFAYQYIGEGASGALFGSAWPVISRNHWYTMMMRVWTPLDTTSKYSYIGRWVKDVEADHWYIYGIMRLPMVATGFTGNAGFLEDFGNECRSARAIHRRLGYYRNDDKWEKSDTVTYDIRPDLTLKNYWVVNKIEDDTVLAMELSSNRAMVPQLLKGEPLAEGDTVMHYSFTVKQPDLPTLDSPEVRNLQVQSNGKQVMVSWEVPASASPQFHYKVEVFDNAQCAGKPAAVHEDRMPTTRDVVLAAAIANPTIRFSMTDIFDQTLNPIVVQAVKAGPPAKAIESKPTAPGLLYEYWIKDSDRHLNYILPDCDKSTASRNERHIWVSVDEIEDGKMQQQGICRGFDVELRGKRGSGYAFRFHGLLRVPETGFYLLGMRGTDGYSIKLDGKDAIVWDGLHGPQRKVTGLHLAKGDHPLAVEYFVDRHKPFFSMEWQAPGLERQEIPSTALLHELRGDMPESRLQIKTDDNGGIEAQVEVEPNGHKIERIHFFFDKMRISSAQGSTLTYNGVLPGGEHKVWARVFYDGNNTVDSQIVSVTVAMKKLSGWELGIAGEKKATYNILQTAPNAFSFVGDGEYVINREIEGDFTLTCKIDHCLGVNGEPVNGSSWVGLTAREHPERNNYGWGQEFGLMLVARNGLRTTPDHGDGAGTRQSYQRLPSGHSWLRIVREGNVWSAWTSADGSNWKFGTSHLKQLSPKVGAGIVFRALPQDAQMHFRASVSQVSLTAGVPKDDIAPVTAATGTKSARLTGVIVAPSNPKVVVIRTTDSGLLRSEDGGNIWSSANGKLKGAANAVRSVAIHPTNSDVMLRAAGKPDAQGKFQGGLYKTTDGGNTWKKLAVDCDFDAVGPSAICGEVLGFLPMNPETIFAACETRGLYRSDDGGETWDRIISQGQRFTTLLINPYFKNEFNQTVIQASTCPDRFMPLVGRGEPGFSTTEQSAIVYTSHDNGKTFHVSSKRADLGYLNTLSLRCDVSHWLYGTTHGLFFSIAQATNGYMYARHPRLESQRPFTALGGSIAGSQLCTRKFVQALDPAVPGRISRCDLGGDVWDWTTGKGDVPKGVIAIVAADQTLSATGENWWILGTDGLYYSSDSGATVRKKKD